MIIHNIIILFSISISKCVRDVTIFLSIAAIIMLCFSLGINTMYQAYNENRVLDKDGNIIQQKETYSRYNKKKTITYTLKNIKMVTKEKEYFISNFFTFYFLLFEK